MNKMQVPRPRLRDSDSPGLGWRPQLGYKPPQEDLVSMNSALRNPDLMLGLGGGIQPGAGATFRVWIIPKTHLAALPKDMSRGVGSAELTPSAPALQSRAKAACRQGGRVHRLGPCSPSPGQTDTASGHQLKMSTQARGKRWGLEGPGGPSPVPPLQCVLRGRAGQIFPKKHRSVRSSCDTPPTFEYWP